MRGNEPDKLDQRRRRFEPLLVGCASLLVSLWFCAKPFHIDDTLYLRIAEQIGRDPFRPFDGTIHWQQVAEPAWNVSISPPGWSYWLALCMACGVTSEVGLHVAGSIWLAVLGMGAYFWARRLGTWPVPAALLVIASPLVAAGQNLMLDIPMLALAVASVVSYFEAGARRSMGWGFAAGSLAGLAINVKYAAVVVLPVMVIDAMMRRQWRLLMAPVVGAALLGLGQWAWSRDGIPQLLFARAWITQLWPSDLRDVLHRASSSVLYLGASGAWVLLFAHEWLAQSRRAACILVAASAGAAATMIDLHALEPDFTAAAVLHALAFAFNGWIALACAAVLVLDRARAWFVSRAATAAARGGSPNQAEPAALQAGNESTACEIGVVPRAPELAMLLVWTVAFWYLGALNGPFVAPRALLPCVLGVVLIAVAAARERVSAWARRGAVAVTLAMGVVVGAGDYEWAAIYRKAAPKLAAHYRPEHAQLYFWGHWGWQYYAEAAGMTPFDPARTQLRRGDVLIVPSNVDRQILPPGLAQRVRQIGVEDFSGSRWLPRTRALDAFVFFHGDTRHGRLPWGWSWSDRPLERFVILEVVQ